MKHMSALKLVLTALFAALVCVATMLVRIPLPATGGYANLGDGVILIAAFLLHPLHGALAGGLGSMLADLLAGYAGYAPGTLVIKAAVALAAALIYRHIGRRMKRPAAAMLVAGILAEACMVLGYFLYESVVLGMGMGAVGSIPGNLGQAAVGVAMACMIAPVLARNPEVRELMDKTHK